MFKHTSRRLPLLGGPDWLVVASHSRALSADLIRSGRCLSVEGGGVRQTAVLCSQLDGLQLVGSGVRYDRDVFAAV